MTIVRRDRQKLTSPSIPRAVERAAWLFLVVLLVVANHNLKSFLSEERKETDEYSENQFQMAFDESLGFFDDIPEHLWRQRKKIARERKHLGVEWPNGPVYQSRPATWYQENFHPDFACFNEDQVGGNLDGHKWVCDPYRLKDIDDCLVYSFGSNNDFSFERELHQMAPNCEMHIFDPDDYSEGMKRAGLNASFHVYGLSGSYDTNEKATELRTRVALSAKSAHGQPKGSYMTLDEHMKALGHTGRRVDIFKIDCEGCEWKLYRDFLQQDLRQVLIETHQIVPVSTQFFQDFHSAGYVMFHKEPNIQFAGGNCVEFAFLKLANAFFQD